MKGLVVAGTRSGVGKTVATLATVRGLTEAGYDVQPAKAGPDFIDPSHHAAVADRPSRTLDLWLEGEAGLRRNYHRGEGDVCVVEGVMGLFDGDASSTAMVAEALSLPVVLVVDASAGMESVTATALGFRAYADRFGPAVDVAGVIAQNARGGRHERGIREALPESIEYLGRIPTDDRLEIPERHLGLHMGTEVALPADALSEAAATLDVDRLVALASEPPAGGEAPPPDRTDATVAVARDEAFCFVYPAAVERLRQRATVETVSPVAGDPLPAVDAVYLPGGYPELHAEALAASGTLEAVGRLAADGVPVYGECGGFMALAEALVTTEGERHEMAGVLPATVQMHDRYQALDHVELVARPDTPVAGAGERRRAHEFHYSSATLGRDARLAFDVERGDGVDGSRDGLLEHRTVGTYTHLHAESGAFDRLVEVGAALA